MATYSSYETDLEGKIKSAVEKDEKYKELIQKIAENSADNDNNIYRMSKNGLLMCKNRLYIPNSDELKALILNEIHKKPYSGHPGYQKTITMLRKEFYWPKMKREVAKYLAKCLECRLVKAEHQHPAGLLQPLPIPEWKWEIISLDFITGLPRNARQNDSIMVVVDKLSKAAHFIPVRSTFKVVHIVEIFMKFFFRLHGILKIVIFDTNAKFTGNFWKALFKGLDTQLNFSTAFHPQTDGQTEQVNQILEDMLRMYVMNQPKKWEE